MQSTLAGLLSYIATLPFNRLIIWILLRFFLMILRFNCINVMPPLLWLFVALEISASATQQKASKKQSPVSPIVVVAAPPFAFPLLRGRSSGFWILAEYPAFCCCSHFWLSHRCRLMRHGTHTAPSACGYIESRPKQRRVVRWSHLVLATRPPSPAPAHLAVAGAPAIVCMHIKFNRMYSLHSMRCDAPLPQTSPLYSFFSVHSAYT